MNFIWNLLVYKNTAITDYFQYVVAKSESVQFILDSTEYSIDRISSGRSNLGSDRQICCQKQPIDW